MHRPFPFWNFHRVRTVASIVPLVLGTVTLGSASAYTLNTLHSFCTQADCSDGGFPRAGLVKDSAGNLYGTASTGGEGHAGIVFKLVPNANGSKYKEHVLYSFCSAANCTDGKAPFSDLILDVDGRLYGTTLEGGNNNNGVVFQLSHSGNGSVETVIHTFCAQQGCADGDRPPFGLSYAGQQSGAPWDEFSPLFGAAGGGKYGHGIDYELTSDGSLWNFSIIHDFQSSSDPNELLIDSSGNIFGTTNSRGKYGGGLLYKLTSGTWKETVFHNFCKLANCVDGRFPVGRLAVDSSGNLFGTTSRGGANDGGVVFRRGTGGTTSVLYSFCSQANCQDGSTPAGGVAMKGSGSLLGLTEGGGSNFGGVAFKLANKNGAWTESVLYSFCSKTDCADGIQPTGEPILDSSGDLFGATTGGGVNGDHGTVFELTP